MGEFPIVDSLYIGKIDNERPSCKLLEESPGAEYALLILFCVPFLALSLSVSSLVFASLTVAMVNLIAAVTPFRFGLHREKSPSFLQPDQPPKIYDISPHILSLFP